MLSSHFGTILWGNQLALFWQVDYIGTFHSVIRRRWKFIILPCVSIYSRYGFACWLVCLGCYNEIPQIGYVIINRNLLLTILEAWSLSSGHQNGQIRTLVVVHSWHLLALSLHGGRGSWAHQSYLWGVNPHDLSHEAPTNKKHHFWRLGFQQVNFGGTQTFRPHHLPCYMAWLTCLPETPEWSGAYCLIW